MGARTMVQCDNPTCKRIGEPEFVPGEDGPKKRGQQIMGPYGWHQGNGWIIGSGPAYTYMACTDECVGPAIANLVRRARESEWD